MPAAHIPSQTRPAAPPSLRGFSACLGLALAWLALWALAAPYLPVSPLVGYGFGFASVSAIAVAVGYHAPAGRAAGARVSALAVALAGAGLLAVHLLRVPPGLGSAAVVMVCLLAAGSLMGAFVGARIEHPGHLLFVAPVSALADVVSVHHPQGVSHSILASEAALSVLALSFPMLGTAAIEPMLGVGDVVFVALYLAAARAHGLALARTVWALALSLAATAVLVVVTETAIPALPAMGLFVLLALPEARRPRREERRAGFSFLGVLAVVAGWLLIR